MLKKTTTLHVMALMFYAQTSVWAQGSSTGPASPAIWLIIIMILILVAALVGSGLIRARARVDGVSVSRDDSSFFPIIDKILGRERPSFVGNDSFKKLSKGFNINLEGVADEEVHTSSVRTIAVQPTNYRGIAPIPKLLVEVGQHVKAGDPLFFDKTSPDIHYCAPASGEIIEIRRGAKRAITAVIISADEQQTYRQLEQVDPFNVSREDLVKHLMGSGFWPAINQRPYDVVADPDIIPRDIFISTFDTAPLAPSNSVIFTEAHVQDFQMGVNILSRLTDGHVHLGLSSDAGANQPLADINGVHRHWFSGPHPAGNVGIQIHHIAPIRPGHRVWTLDKQDVILLGQMFAKGIYAPKKVVAITGQSVKTPTHVQVTPGALMSELLADKLHEGQEVRIISGDVLSGEHKTEHDFVNWGDDQVTVIPEGQHHEMFGWLLPAFDRPTVSKTYLTHLAGDLQFEVDTNTHGERRAFVQTGQYESVMPASIYPQHLMKAIMIKDYEKMEGLGIHELTEEDVALCEFTCTSKQPLQEILRDGLDYMRAQEG